MDNLQELYEQTILEHNRNPRNYGELPHATHHAEGFNPLCGDKITVDLILDEHGIVEDIHFSGAGCAISQASASLMTTILKGKTEAEARGIFDEFHSLLTKEDEISDSAGITIPKLKVFQGVRAFPSRVKCASLAWHTCIAALDQKEEISTE